ncbi:MAG: RnfABCDGE type electron transport complex subunit G [Candidatus Omnitrophota bacterium]|nr:RnfABCDGE type electron transport complex subunit G [Candidatus Omnitrophota bacterium]
MIRYGIILLVICLCASLVLSLTYKITHAKIEAQEVETEKDLLDDVFPQAATFEDKMLDGKRYYIAEKDGQELGYIIKVEAGGYSSTIVMLAGFDKTGKIEGVEVLSQQETPGLGAKIAEVKAGEKKPWFLKQFAGKRIEEVDLKNIHAITAATITSKAATDAVRTSVEEFLAKIK